MERSMGLAISELTLPEAGSESADFLAAVEVVRQERLNTWGNDDLAYSPDEVLAMAKDPYEDHIYFIAKSGDTVIGQSEIILPLQDNPHLAWVWLSVDPAHPALGVGKELLAESESYIKARGRSNVVVETSHPVATVEADGERLAPSSGVGSLPLTSREVRLRKTLAIL